MAFFRTNKKSYLIILLIQLSIITANESKKFCDSETNCDNCIFCEINTQNNNNQCSIKNLFCIHNQTNELIFNDTIFPKYKSFFQKSIENQKVYSNETINLDNLKNSFNIIKINSKDNKNLNKIHFYCLITNSKYFKNKKDSAILSIGYNLQNSIIENITTKNILFYIIFENTQTNDSLILNGDDKKIRNLNWKAEINEYDKIIILLEFYNNNIFVNDDDYFEIEIKTKNISIIIKRIIIRIIGIIIIILALIIVPCNIYTCIKKKKLNEKIKRKLEKERTKNEEIFQKIFKNILIETELSSKNIIENYPQCAICLQAFELKCSICITPCKHVFHYECLKKFAEAEKNVISTLKCPLCNFVFWNENLNDDRHNIKSDRNFDIYNTVQYKIIISNCCFNNNN